MIDSSIGTFSGSGSTDIGAVTITEGTWDNDGKVSFDMIFFEKEYEEKTTWKGIVSEDGKIRGIRFEIGIMVQNVTFVS